MELIAFLVAELYAHFTQFFYADSVFTGNRAALFDTELQNLTPELFGLFQLTRVVGIVEYQRVEVAITGMENIRDR